MKLVCSVIDKLLYRWNCFRIILFRLYWRAWIMMIMEAWIDKCDCSFHTENAENNSFVETRHPCLCIINTDAKVSKYKNGVCVYFEEVFQSQIGGEYAICVAFICGSSECNEYGSKLYIIMCITGKWFGLIAVLFPLWYREPSITTNLYARAIFNSSGRVTENRVFHNDQNL